MPYTQVKISTNGYVCLGGDDDINTTIPGCDRITPLSPYNILVGLNRDLDPTQLGSGQIYYKRLSDEEDASDFDFNSAKLFVNSININFVPKYVFMITYDEVFNSGWGSSFPVSFQMFLYSGYNSAYKPSSSLTSYVTFKYKSCSVCIGIECALSGFNYNNAGSLQELIIPYGQECYSSNVGQKRIWVSEVTSFSYVSSI